MTIPGSTERSSLLGAVRIRQLALELDLRPTKTLGQNFVHDANTVRRIIATAELHTDDHVLEVGPGLGSLTLGLLDQVDRVTAVEIDRRMADLLPRTVAELAPTRANRLRVINADALGLRAADWGEPTPHRVESGVIAAPDGGRVLPTAVVANLPYNVSVPVLLHVLAEFDGIRRVLVMVQAEVADRLAAPPGSRTYGVPSVKAAWYGTVRRVGAVGRRVFWPEPNVDSALVSLDRRPVPTSVRRETVFTLVDHAFAQRRKMLRTALAGFAGSPAAAELLLREAGIDPARRGETLNLAEYVAVAAVAEAASPAPHAESPA